MRPTIDTYKRAITYTALWPYSVWLKGNSKQRPASAGDETSVCLYGGYQDLHKVL